MKYQQRLDSFLMKNSSELGAEMVGEILKKRQSIGEGSFYERIDNFKREQFERRFFARTRKKLKPRVELVKLEREKCSKIKNNSEGIAANGSTVATHKKGGRGKRGGKGIEKESDDDIFPFGVELSEEDAIKAVWKEIGRKQIPKLVKQVNISSATRTSNAKKVAQACSSYLKKQLTRLAPKPTVSARKLMKEMLLFWRKNEREERELRKRAEKEAAERRRLEEEQREARRQAKKLNFLITQTELYTHFVSKKVQSGQQESPENAPVFTREIDFADVEDSVLHGEAERIAKRAALAHQSKLKQFDQGMDFMNPSTLKDAAMLEQPSVLQFKLKSYQLKGLTWLGINGILADEMGLGKTIQSISLLAHLAERQNNWGPFLVISPASTLHNWQEEFAKFVPAFKVLPYWGSVQDRKILRSTCFPYWSGKKPVTKDSPFHVMVTSYQLIVSDEAYLQKIKWKYMILDEAQALKSSSSIRWKTLLSFNCRNRLLLTGTPIQNSMQELWALLHFIMPTLFDSHDEFSEWFSKDIESHAENKGSLNSHQLSRLHMILKPFMLRRVKKDVENEMGEKIEKDIICELGPRQHRIYQAIKEKLPFIDLLEKQADSHSLFNFGFGMGSSDRDSSIDSALMNIVMQFRKVCNHPELFERTEISSPFSFTLDQPQPSATSQIYLRPQPNPIEFKIPRMIFKEFVMDKENNQRFIDYDDTLVKIEMKRHQVIQELEPPSHLNNVIGTERVIARPIKMISSVSPLLLAPPTYPQNSLNFLDLQPDLSSSITVPSVEKLIRDGGKLIKLDELLRKLFSENHRVLIYNQMTRMIDLMEDYLQYRNYKYVRLDGSTNIATRRDLVHSWQTDPTIFIFLLSTRAGGLGINLTAADTVIFYDSDWNPTVDQQAMDRAHRLGQTKQVTVYRLITRGTIEERIMQRAKQKDEIHKVVIAGGEFKQESEDREMVSFLLDAQ